MRKLLFTSLLTPAALLFGEGGPYVLCEPMGQLGNQYFQIAATVSLAWDHGATPIFPSFLYEEEWNMPINYKELFSHLDVTTPDVIFNLQYLEPYFIYQPIPYAPNMSIRGWFQSERYFRHHKEEILNLFAPPSHIKEYLAAKYPHIVNHPQTVAIHYRSYAAEDPDHKVYAKVGLDYYEKAIRLFPKETLFVVFSNDIAWCKEAFSSLARHFTYIEGEPHYRDLHLISFCKHQIICNSSFSWWGAYLNKNPDKQVIAPAVWFTPEYGTDDRDLIPLEWKRI